MFGAPEGFLTENTLRALVDYWFHDTVSKGELEKLLVVLNVQVNSYPAIQDQTEEQSIEQRQVQSCVDALGFLQMSLDGMAAPRGPTSTAISTMQSFVGFVGSLQTALTSVDAALLPDVPVTQVVSQLDRIAWTGMSAWAAGAVIDIVLDLWNMWQDSGEDLDNFVAALLEKLASIWLECVWWCGSPLHL